MSENRIIKYSAQRPEKYRTDLVRLGLLVKDSGQYQSVRNELLLYSGSKTSKSYKRWKKQQINKAIKAGKLAGIITPSFIMWLIIRQVIVSFLEDLFFGE